VLIHLARIETKLGDLPSAQKNLEAVTNEMYATVKRTLDRNLKAAQVSITNSTPVR
jgi:hypothetical protein